MMFVKVETINEGILRSAIRFACEKQGVSPDECYEVIGRKILNGDFTAICGSWYDAFAAYYLGAAAFFGPTSGFQERDKRILDLEKQLAALRTNAPSFTDNTKPTKPLASAGANELVEALDLALPEATCISCNDGPEKHRITVSVKWCNHSEVVAEYLPSLTGPKKPTKPARIAINPREVIEEPALESVFCECDRMVLPNGTIKHLPHCPLSEDS